MTPARTFPNAAPAATKVRANALSSAALQPALLSDRARAEAPRPHQCHRRLGEAPRLWLLLALGLTRAVAADAPAHDVVIYGGTPAGLIAAIAAARAGVSVVVIEPTRWIGGMVTGGLARTDVGRPETVGGITREFFARAAVRYGGKFMWFAEPHANLETFELMLREAKVEVVRGQRLLSVTRNGLRIARLTTGDGKTYAGRTFVDATYEGDLLARAGVSYLVGREGRETYGEPLAGFFPMEVRPRTEEVMGSVCACLGGTGAHYVHGTPTQIAARDAAGRLLAGINESRTLPGAADRLTQSYNFRLIVTRRADNRIPFPQPARYDPARYELLRRLLAAYPGVRFGRLFHLGDVAGDKFDLNAQGFFSTDYAGGNFDYPDGDYPTRDRIWQDHVDYVQGILWFLGHDEGVPRGLRDETNEWGLCRDEFADNAHWPYALYVREARRMIGDTVMTQPDCQTAPTKPDAVAMGSFVIDSHIVQRVVAADGTVFDEGAFPDAPVKPYEISYRVLTPRKSECANLLVPVCVSASHIACCSLRMEPVYMALGHAAGLAAVTSARSGRAVQEIEVAALQAELRAQKQVLRLPPPRPAKK